MKYFAFSLTVLSITLLILGCGENTTEKTFSESDTQIEASPPSNGQDAGERFLPTNELTKSFFERIVQREIGDEVGAVELRDMSGILIHPGETTPTVATFRLAGEYSELRLNLFIGPLSPEGQAVAEAGTVNVEILLDGRSVLKSSIDRAIFADETLDVRSAQELTIRVDNGNGKPWYDWFFVSVKSAT